MVRGSDPILWSFGHQGAPNQYRLSQDRRVHQLLRVPVERYVPTKAEILRSKTGYWSWLQWRLGEGDWQHYPASTASVRPNVPKVISPEWWVRYKQFIANRHSGNESKTATPMKLAA
jgi:hypothetical protein